MPQLMKKFEPSHMSNLRQVSSGSLQKQLIIFSRLVRGTLVKGGKFLLLILLKALFQKVLLLFLEVSPIWVPIWYVLLSWASILLLVLLFPFPIAGFFTSDSSLSNISSVLSASFADRVNTLYPQEAGLASLLRNGGFYVKAQTRRMARDQPLRMQALDDELTDQNQIIEYNPSDFAKHCHCVMSKEEVMTKFHVGPKTAEKTLQHTRQDGTRITPIFLCLVSIQLTMIITGIINWMASGVPMCFSIAQ